jgi:hypothetical protein
MGKYGKVPRRQCRPDMNDPPTAVGGISSFTLNYLLLHRPLGIIVVTRVQSWYPVFDQASRLPLAVGLVEGSRARRVILPQVLINRRT